MTEAELNALYTEAGWLIAKRSAMAGGKALLLGSEDLDETKQAIAAIYGLSDGEIGKLKQTGRSDALAGIRNLAEGMLGNTTVSGGQAISLARDAIRSGRKMAVVGAFMKAGPKAAQAALAGGKAAGNMGKGTPWGWIATAGYAVGSAGWFAYNARAFNLEVFELVRAREGITPTVGAGGKDGTSDGEAADAAVAPAAATPIASRVSTLGGKAGAAAANVADRLPRIRS